jgi:hypothetical protein
MNVTVSCSQCGTQYSIQRELLGRRSKCAKCGVAFTLVETSPTAAPVVAPSVAPAVAVEPQLPDFGSLPQFELEPPVTPAGSPRPTPRPAARPTEGIAPSFWALRFMARSYEVFAVISLVAIMIPIVLMVQTLIQFPTLATLVVVRYSVAIASLLASAVVLFLIAQLIRLILQVEQNTRETSEACRQLVEHLGAIESAE